MTLQTYLSYLVASFLLIISPGSVVTLVLSASLAQGLRAGLGVVLGATLGTACLMLILIVGLGPLVLSYPTLFDALRLIGAVYLLWLGVSALRAKPVSDVGTAALLPERSFVIQGLLIALSNPKTLLFFAAFLPQFVDPQSAYRPQALLLGASFLVMAAASDSLYAFAASKARAFVSGKGAVMLQRISGLCLIVMGLALGLSRLVEVFRGA